MMYYKIKGKEDSLYMGDCFTDLKHILSFIDCGSTLVVAKVANPEDAKLQPKSKAFVKYKLNNYEIVDTKEITDDVIIDFAKQGAYMHLCEEFPLCWAVENGRFNLVKFFVENDSDIHIGNDELLRNAVQNDYVDIAEYLIDSGIDVNSNNGSPLIVASIYSSEKMIQMLVEKGADVNVRGCISLYWAITNDKPGAVALFCEKGSKLNSFTLDSVWSDDGIMTPALRVYLDKLEDEYGKVYVKRKIKEIKKKRSFTILRFR